MNTVLLHRIFGFILATVGTMIGLTGFMFWFDPPDLPLRTAVLAAMMIFGVVVLAGGIGVMRRSAAARRAMIVAAGLVLAVIVIGVVRAALAANLGEVVILLTAVMPAVLVTAVLYELGRPEREEP
ncbi:hypothetical protein V5738_01735 [Salinisphaera sp. SPP-AMP-43]|uniref:hypothetical protein n=1 Tax=Salinisphaera sp. SPP-AMP-43 TaxID=3121288 RepID=UPI003C6DCF34